jgi:hypothetical protein
MIEARGSLNPRRENSSIRQIRYYLHLAREKAFPPSPSSGSHTNPACPNWGLSKYAIFEAADSSLFYILKILAKRASEPG